MRARIGGPLLAIILGILGYIVLPDMVDYDKTKLICVIVIIAGAIWLALEATLNSRRRGDRVVNVDRNDDYL